MRAFLVVALLATPAAADHKVGVGYMMSRPIAGTSGGADHASVMSWLTTVGSGLDIGVALELGHAPGNTDESLTRFAVLPTLGLRRTAGDVLTGIDVAVGWQLADGNTNVAGVPVRGTEARGLRSELGVYLGARATAGLVLRARVGITLDGIYPQQLESQTTVGPFVELGLQSAL